MTTHGFSPASASVTRFFVLLCVAVSGLSAQPASPKAAPPKEPPDLIDRVEGLWELTSTNTPEPGKTERSHLSLRKPRILLRNGVPMSPGEGFSGDTGSNWTYRRDDAAHWLDYTPTNLAYQGDGSFLLTGYWGRQSHFRPVGPDEMRGTWKHGNRSGQETWRRLTPRVTELEFQGRTSDRVIAGERPGRLHVNYEPGQGMRGNKSEFRIRILGDNLSFHHFAHIEGTDIEAYWTRFITGTNTGRPHDVIGLELRGYVWSKATPGPKRIHFGNIAIPFQLDLEGFPPDAVTFDWLVADSLGARRPATDAPVGADVVLRARSFQPRGPDRMETTVRLIRANGARENVPVKLSRTAPGLMLESPPLHLFAGDASQSNSVRVLGGDRLEATSPFGSATLTVVPPEMKIRLVEQSSPGIFVQASEPLVFGTAFFVEVLFDRPRAESVLSVDLSWQPGRTEPMEVHRVAGDVLAYRSREIRLLPATRRTP